MGDLDPAFLQDADHRPNPEYADLRSTVDLPVIDLSSAEAVAEIQRACAEWGFFQATNHGVPAELRARVEDAARSFFSATAEEKRGARRGEGDAMGYHDGENTKNVRDWKEVFDFLLEDRTVVPASHEDDDDDELRTLVNRWPLRPSEFREVCEEYAREMEKLAFKLLSLIGQSLGLHRDRLNGFFQGQTSFVRLNYYPPCPFPDWALGVGRHKDASALTILAQDQVGGLQIRGKLDGRWIPVKPNPNALVINVGDIFQVWSNDKYESVEHRVVVNSEKERFSIPFFLFPGHHINVSPLPDILDGKSPRYREYNWGKFFANRNRSDFKKRAVENIQIHHYRIGEN